MLKNSYSVVAYPVGYHIDTFKENKPCFENKICFIQSKCSMSCHGEGRGGAGGGNYVWVLLDWRGSNGYKQRHIYDRHNGPHVKRLTQNKFDNWVQEMEQSINVDINIENYL